MTLPTDVTKLMSVVISRNRQALRRKSLHIDRVALAETRSSELLTWPSNEQHNIKLSGFVKLLQLLPSFRSRSLVHRDLKADNALMTATEDWWKIYNCPTLAFLKQTDLPTEDDFCGRAALNSILHDLGSWPDTLSGPWIFTRFSYTEKADVFSPGVLFYAILERGKTCRGQS